MQTARNFNDIINVWGYGNVTVIFSNIYSPPTIYAKLLPIGASPNLIHVSKDINGTMELVTLDNMHYMPVGTIFSLEPADLNLNGTITVIVPINSSRVHESQLYQASLLHHTGIGWEDVTLKSPLGSDAVTGTVDTMGPLVVAIKS